MSAGLSSEEEGLIDVVELAKDWGLEITEEQLEEYERLIAKRQQLQEAERQQSERGMGKAIEACQGQQSGETNGNLHGNRR